MGLARYTAKASPATATGKVVIAGSFVVSITTVGMGCDAYNGGRFNEAGRVHNKGIACRRSSQTGND